MTLSRLALLGLTVALSSCAVSLCDKDPTDPRCDQSPVSPDTLQVLPIRIPLSGENLTVRLGVGTGTVVLKQGGKEAALGQLRQRLPASELLAVANARARLPTWLASQVSSLVTRA